jgi:hemolysin D
LDVKKAPMLYQQKEINTFLKLGTTLSIATVLLLLWIFFAKLDVVAEASGQIIPDSRLKTVQVLGISMVKDIYVKEGAFVKQGQVVAELDSTEAISDQKAITDDVELNDLILRRIEAELNNKELQAKEKDDPIKFNQVKAELLSRKSSYQASLSETNSILLQAQNDLLSTEIELSKQEQSLAFWNKQIDSYQHLKTLGNVAEITANDKTREAQDRISEHKIQKQRILIAQSKVAELKNKLIRIKQDYLKQLMQEKTDILNKQVNKTELLKKANHKVKLTQLIAPVHGIVKDLTTNSRNAVLTEGSVLMTIVPQNDVKEAELLVKNEDIGYLKNDMPVKIKVASFPYQKYGLISGHITNISPDATEAKNANEQQAGYKVRIKLDKDYLGSENKFYIKEGMRVNADIKISERTIFEYLVSPLQKIAQESGRER